MNFGTPICDSGCSPARPRSGSSWLWFGRTALEQASVEQSVMLPVGAGELTFYLWISDSSGNAQDHMRVLMDGVELFSVVEGDPTYTSGYTQVMIDVSAFANGGTHTLRFESAVTGPAVSNFHVDDVALAGCERALSVPIPAGPSGSISETTPTFVWSAVADATTYQLVVDNVTDGITVIDQAGIGTTSFAPASALTSERDYKWRVLATDGVNQSPFSIDTFFAIDVIAPDAITDLAAGPAPSSPVLVTAPAVDSSGDRSDAKSKEKATDGDPLTFWSTPARAVAQHEFITMDTASVHRIGRVRVLSRDRGSFFPEDLEIQVSDDNVDFTTVHQVFGLPATTSTWHSFDFAPAQGRYVRVYVTKARKTSGKYKVHIAEIQVYESPIVTGSLSLSWTAPGDNGSLGTAASYALKWSLSPIDSGNFGSATPVTLSPPLPPGSLETATLTGLPDETRVYFAITTSDEVPLTSALSNVADAATLGTPPAPVNDLAASNPTGTTVDLTWTAVADVGPDPQAGSYDLRYSTGPINDNNFSSATPLPGAGALVAKTAGQVETFTATGLPVETLIYFAVKVVDKLGNTSPADTGAEPSAMTLDTSAPDAITDLAAGPAPSSPVLVTAPAVDSSGDRSDAKSKEKATDGDPLTFWSTPARAVAQHEFITMDTASVHRIGRVRVLSRDRGSFFPEDLEIQVSDDNVDFTTVHQVFGLPATTSTWHSFDFAPAQGRYVRVYVTKARKTSGKYKVHIAEIQVYESPIVTGSLSLSWTAPGDNGSLGTAASYALKWSLSPIDSGNFGSATPVTLSPPLPPGSLETATLTGLPDETRVYFAITTSDEVPLTSALSNVADAVTPASP